jgi:DNA helicase-2/ATP-dependent DNA helicase PcrA
MEAASQAVLQSIAEGRKLEPGAPWARETELLLQEHNAARGANEVELPAHISASMLVELKDNPAEVTRSLRRPVPRRPGMAARKGTAFHSWVEDHFGTAGMLDLDDMSSPADSYVDEAYDLEAMKATFKASEWAAKSPAAIEVPVETRVDEVVVRGVRAVQLAVYRLAWARLQGIDPAEVKAAFYYVAADKTVRPHDLAGEAELEAIVRAAYAGSER